MRDARTFKQSHRPYCHFNLALFALRGWRFGPDPSSVCSVRGNASCYFKSDCFILFYFSSQGTSSPVSLRKGALTTHCVHTVVLASSKDFVNICFTSYYNIDIFFLFFNNGILDQPYVSLFNFVLILNMCKKIIKLFMFQLIRTMVYFCFLFVQ